MHRNLKVLGLSLALALAAASVQPAFGQIGAASINGTVVDASNAAVPNADVTVSNMAAGIDRKLKTNGAGVFSAPGLPPGPGYKVEVTANGFAASNTSDIQLEVGQNLNLALTMAVGQTASSVEVSAAAQLIDDQKTDVSGVVGSNEITNLPINGRRVDSFVLIQPGVTNDATFGLLTFRGIAGNNSFLLDGNDNTEQFYDENAGRTRIQSQISEDAVQEFQVVSANVSAEYGRAMGGVVNTVTKSGGNQFHGTAFYFLRSTGFDAHDPYSAFNPTEHRVQTGGTVGGPIIKNKLFFFLSTDITRRNFPFVDSEIKSGIVNPSNATWMTCGLPATPAQCNAINALLPRFYGQTPRTASNDLYFGRMDYHLNDKNTFSTSFNFLRWVSPNGIQTGLSSTTGAGITGNGDDHVTVRNGRASWTTILSGSMVNTFHYGLDTDRQSDAFDSAELGGGLAYLDVSVAGVQLGPPTYLPRVQPLETRNEFSDDFNWVRGHHNMKFGVSTEHVGDTVNTLTNRFGSYTYPSVTAFAEDYSGNTTGAKNWTTFSQTTGGNPIVSYTVKDIGIYAQDQWQVNNRLTLSYGLRYEYSWAPPSAAENPAFPQTGVPYHEGPLDLAPRIGVSYRVNDKTVIRAGVGTYFARLIAGIFDDQLTGNGLYQSPVTLSSTNSTQFASGPVFPNILPPGGAPSGSTLDVFSPKLKTPYSEQANITVERQLTNDVVLSVSGIFSKGVNLYGTQDINAQLQANPFTYKIDDASGNQVGTYTTPVYSNVRPNPNFGAIYELTNGVSSSYNALAISVTKRMSHGIQMQGSYTWSHEIDDGQGAGGSSINIFGFSDTTWTYNGNYGFDKGSGLLDQRQRLVYSFVWTPKFSSANNAFAKYLVNGWQLSSITTLMSGRPSGSETVLVTDTPVSGMLYGGDALDGFNGNFRVPFVPVDTLYTPWVQQENFRLTKFIPVYERINLSLNFEAFNISNNWSPTSLTSQAYSEKGGVLTYTPAAFNVGSGDGGFPDGTQARRLQVSARITF